MTLPTVLVEELARTLEQETGIWLDGGLGVRLEDGVDAAARQAGETPGDFARRVVAREPAAFAAFLEHVVVTESAFWRHPEQLSAVARIACAADRPVAIWSAGCAAGEEAYSVAIALLEAGREGCGDRILGTDVSSRALATARAGVYGPRAFRRMPPELAERWFEGRVERRVRSAVRDLVSFERHNLASEAPPAGPFDVVLCRNVLIYFGSAAAAAAVRRLAGALRPGGVLVFGPVELPAACPRTSSAPRSGALEGAAGADLEWIPGGGTTLLRRRAGPGA
jgi:chemotaxis protein methyltransferase CheR